MHDNDGRIMKEVKKLIKKLKKLNWSNPRIIITVVGLCVLPFVAKHYVSTGLLLGVLLAMIVLWLIEKAPPWMRRLIHKYPLAADLLLSTLAVMLVGSYFGSGLILGLGAVFCALILSWALQCVDIEPEVQEEPDLHHAQSA